jgi:WD40 repeat protein
VTTFSPHSNDVVAGLWTGEVRTIGIDDGTVVSSFKGATAPVSFIAFPKCARGPIAGWLNKQVRIWSSTSLSDSTVLATNGIPREALIDAECKFLVVVLEDSSIEVRRFQTGELYLATGASPHQDITALDISDDGSYLVYGTDKGGIKIWDLKTGETHESLTAHKDRIVAAKFTRSGLVTASWDGGLLMWSYPCRFPRRTDPGFPLRTDPA